MNGVYDACVDGKRRTIWYCVGIKLSDGIRKYNDGVCYCRITAVLVGYGQAYEVGNVACGSIYKAISLPQKTQLRSILRVLTR